MLICHLARNATKHGKNDKTTSNCFHIMQLSIKQAVPTPCLSLKVRIALYGNPSQSYRATWVHTVLPATRHKWTRPALTPASQASTRFTYTRGMEGWVDLGSLIAAQLAIESTTAWSQVRCPNHYATKPPVPDPNSKKKRRSRKPETGLKIVYVMDQLTGQKIEGQRSTYSIPSAIRTYDTRMKCCRKYKVDTKLDHTHIRASGCWKLLLQKFTKFHFWGPA